MNGDGVGAKEWSGLQTRVSPLERQTSACAVAVTAGSSVVYMAAWLDVRRLHEWTRDSPIGPGWRETLTRKKATAGEEIRGLGPQGKPLS